MNKQIDILKEHLRPTLHEDIVARLKGTGVKNDLSFEELEFIKPKLYKSKLPFLSGWFCADDNLYGYGDTPVQAYSKWANRRINSNQTNVTVYSGM